MLTGGYLGGIIFQNVALASLNSADDVGQRELLQQFILKPQLEEKTFAVEAVDVSEPLEVRVL